MSKPLAEKVAVVTGASRGIGRAIALRLGRDGASIAVHYGRNREAADRAVKEIQGAGGTAFSIGVELGTLASVEELFDSLDLELTSRNGSNRFDILVNNAAIAPDASVEATTHKQWTQLARPPSIQQNEHYGMVIVQKSSIRSQKEVLTRFLATWILATRFMQDPKNVNAFAKIASDATGDPLAADRIAIPAFQKIGYWDQTDRGLTKARVLGSLKILEGIGAVKASQAPSYNQMVDFSLYPGAERLLSPANG